jgi:phosphoribosylpyrophosphate synthetase
VGLAFNISKAKGLSLVYPQLRLFSDGESKVRIREKLGNKTCIIVQSAIPPQVDRHLLQAVMLLKKCIVSLQLCPTRQHIS